MTKSNETYLSMDQSSTLTQSNLFSWNENTKDKNKNSAIGGEKVVLDDVMASWISETEKKTIM